MILNNGVLVRIAANGTGKAQGSIKVKTVFGPVEVPNPRWHRCSCQSIGPSNAREPAGNFSLRWRRQRTTASRVSSALDRLVPHHDAAHCAPAALIAHPLWSRSEPAGRLAQALGDLQTPGCRIVVVDSFELARRPTAVRERGEADRIDPSGIPDGRRARTNVRVGHSQCLHLRHQRVKTSFRAYTRDAAIGPNKPDRSRAEFLLFGLILAHLLIKSPLQPRFLRRKHARKRSLLRILRNGEEGCERSQDLTDVSTDYAEAMKSFFCQILERHWVSSQRPLCRP
jgi:hypothetical protein